MIWGIREISMVVAGSVLGLIGPWLLVFRRPKGGKQPLHLADETPAPPKLSEPTRLTIALACLIGGFHGVIWALPPELAGVQLNRHLWYVWILIGIAVVTTSIWLDGHERADPPRSGD